MGQTMKKTTRLSAYAAGAVSPAQVPAFHRARFGDARMEAGEPTPPERPEGVSEEEWNALGDPGKVALQRERQARAEAEQKLADATKPKPTPPAQAGRKPADQQGDGPNSGDQQDIAALIAQAVQAAVAPFQQEQQQWRAEQAATRIREHVTAAAQGRFHDASDVLAQVDVSDLTDGNGAPDPAKITAALDDLAQRKPHLVRPQYAPRTPAPGAPFGGGQSQQQTLDDRVKESLARMQQSSGVHVTATA